MLNVADLRSLRAEDAALWELVHRPRRNPHKFPRSLVRAVPGWPSALPRARVQRKRNAPSSFAALQRRRGQKTWREARTMMPGARLCRRTADCGPPALFLVKLSGALPFPRSPTINLRAIRGKCVPPALATPGGRTPPRKSIPPSLRATKSSVPALRVRLRARPACTWGRPPRHPHLSNGAAAVRKLETAETETGTLPSSLPAPPAPRFPASEVARLLLRGGVVGACCSGRWAAGRKNAKTQTHRQRTGTACRSSSSGSPGPGSSFSARQIHLS